MIFRKQLYSKLAVRELVDKQLQQHARCLSSGPSSLPRFDYKVEGLLDTNYNNIPQLPLPSVNSTLKRYLETVKPLSSEEEFAKTAKLAKEFEENDAPGLHRALQDLTKDPDQYPHSYIEKFWDNMYLGGRWPVCVNSNPMYLFPSESNPAEQDQTLRAAKLASTCVRWWQKVTGGTLEADMERDNPLCMYGFGLIFGATRVPQIGRDRLETNYHRKHVVVLCNHQVFRVDVIDENGQAINTENLKKVLDNIKNTAMSRQGDIMQDVGILTANERDYFATLREHLLVGEPNKETLETIDDCLFAITLDDTECKSPKEASDLFLHGAGTPSSRWYDKHNIIATADGSLGMNFDHTFGDGLTWNRMLSEVWADMHGQKTPFSALPAPSNSFSGSIKELKWDLPPAVLNEMPKAIQNAKDLAQDVDTAILEFEEYGRNRMKEMKCSPDAVCQMAFQLAYARLHDSKLPAVYESCAMKNFYHGRTETIRSATWDSLQLVQSFLNDASTEEKRAKLQGACKTHVQVAMGAKAAVDGPFQGVDRHLHAMRCIAEEQGKDLPFYQDPSYSRSSTWTLSTSNVTAPFIHLFAFGAVTGNGYGLGYMTQPDKVPVNVTSYHSSKETSSSDMAEAIAQSLRDFESLF